MPVRNVPLVGAPTDTSGLHAIAVLPVSGRLENVVKGFVDALTAVAREGVDAQPTAATAAASGAAPSSSPSGKHESGWDLIRQLVQLLRTKGNQYGYAVGVRYQEWSVARQA